MSNRTSSWPVRIACVTIPPALALAAIFYCSLHKPPTVSSAAYADAAEVADTPESDVTVDSPSPQTLQGQAPLNSDVRVALFAMREAAQSHLVCDALRVMSYSKVEPEEIDKISRALIDGTKEISIPLLEKQIEESSGDQGARALLEAIGRLQHLVVSEAEAIRHYAVVDATPESTLKVFEATRAYQKQVAELMQQLDGKEE